MNVYDFDKTIYSGDSTVDFYLFCLARHPVIIKMLPRQIISVIRYFAGNIDKTTMKENFFSFLSNIPNIEREVDLFWSKNEGKLRHWYLLQMKADDVVISASPEFLIQPICEKIGIKHTIASIVDTGTGKFLSTNCRENEKVIRFRKEFPLDTVDEFYSDSESDLPMAELATEAYIVKRNRIRKWK